MEFNEEKCAQRLLEEYRKYSRLFIGIDFDNTLRSILSGQPDKEVVELLRRCSEDPKFCICLWSICIEDQKEIQEKLDFCKEHGIKIHYVNDSPHEFSDIGRKVFFNLLLDDRAGLESAFNCLKYVLDTVENERNNL